ncbi:MAG: cobalamin biosynthesis protein CbiM [Candidatus Omnitrophica bacterium]|nr:cobalamin biosynthesis protein CbiM [Candidatus Omnitrophota bacterium]
MHIPAIMLGGAVCPVTIAVGVAGGATALYFASKQEEKPTVGKFATVTSMIFAMQMLNFPVQNGTSGHLLGGMLAVSLLGVPYAVLSIALVLAVQAVFFGDGGVNALGANVVNMAFIGAAGAGYLLELLKKKGVHQTVSLAVACWASVVLASLACSIEVALSGAVELSKAVTAMLSVHALVGIGEAILTVVVVLLVSKFAEAWQAKEKAVTLASFGLAIVAAMLSPFASSFPDGLEWVAGKLSFAEFQGFEFPALFPDYQATFISNAAFSTILAGLIGVGIISALTFMAGRVIRGSFAVRS